MSESTVAITTLGTVKNDHCHFTVARAEDGQMLLTSFDQQLQMGTLLFVSRADLISFGQAMIKAARAN